MKLPGNIRLNGIRRALVRRLEAAGPGSTGGCSTKGPYLALLRHSGFWSEAWICDLPPQHSAVAMLLDAREEGLMSER